MKKKLLGLFSAVSCFVAFAIPALAADPDIDTAMTTAFQSVIDKITDTIVSVLPIALGLLGITMAIKFGIGFFKKITGKAS